jgi:hypothetical protein
LLVCTGRDSIENAGCLTRLHVVEGDSTNLAFAVIFDAVHSTLLDGAPVPVL